MKIKVFFFFIRSRAIRTPKHIIVHMYIHMYTIVMAAVAPRRLFNLQLIEICSEINI
jgi:hypothetical protein